MKDDQVSYLVIVDHYRREIADRRIVDGQRLPSVREIARTWGCATRTAHAALKSLEAEGYASAVTGLGYQATFRPDQFAILRVQVDGTRERGEQWGSDAEQSILSAELTPTSGADADVLGVEPGALAVLRRGMVKRDGRVIRMSYSWFPAELADLVPELLVIESTPPGNVARIEQVTGRRTKVTADRFTVDLTSYEQAKVFGVQIGTPLLVRTTVRHDGQGVIEYGVTCFPRHVVLAVEYTDRAAGDAA